MIDIVVECHFRLAPEDKAGIMQTGFAIHSKNEQMNADFLSADKELTAFGITSFINVVSGALASVIRRADQNHIRTKESMIKHFELALNSYLQGEPSGWEHVEVIRYPDQPIPPGGIGG